MYLVLKVILFQLIHHQSMIPIHLFSVVLHVDFLSLQYQVPDFSELCNLKIYDKNKFLDRVAQKVEVEKIGNLVQLAV